MKRFVFALLAAAFLLSGCSSEKRYTAYNYELFDTEIVFIAVCESERRFDELAEICFAEFERYDGLFDIYEPHGDMSNLFDINSRAGEAVCASDEIIELLSYCKEVYDFTDGSVNCAMGAVLSLWHEARETGVLPAREALFAAAKHCDISKLEIDAENKTVRLADAEMRIDVGAVAKGWATGKTAETMKAAGCADFVISAGGNVVAFGTNSGKAWKVGVQNPDGAGNIATFKAQDAALVTSGGYNRFVEIEGKKYHHIIDAQTLYPAEKMKSVTVAAESSAFADAMSTALFQLTPQEALAAAQRFGIEVLIVDNSGNILHTDKIEP